MYTCAITNSGVDVLDQAVASVHTYIGEHHVDWSSTNAVPGDGGPLLEWVHFFFLPILFLAARCITHTHTHTDVKKKK